jgi:hypothetical protein
MTPSGIEPATFRLVAQYLNHLIIAEQISDRIKKRQEKNRGKVIEMVWC